MHKTMEIDLSSKEAYAAFAKKDTSNKFREDGTALSYHGNTIISFINQHGSAMYEAACRVQAELKQQSFADCLAFLPPSSFHMTVLTLCREIDRESAAWPTGLSKDLPMEDIDRELKRRVDAVPFPDDILMIFDECDINRLIVKPADAQSAAKIKAYRDTVADCTGIRHSWHDTFRFHITLDYTYRELDAERAKARDAFCARVTHELRESCHPFRVPKAEFVIFNDMLSYTPDLSERKK